MKQFCKNTIGARLILILNLREKAPVLSLVLKMAAVANIGTESATTTAYFHRKDFYGVIL